LNIKKNIQDEVRKVYFHRRNSSTFKRSISFPGTGGGVDLFDDKNVENKVVSHSNIIIPKVLSPQKRSVEFAVEGEPPRKKNKLNEEEAVQERIVAIEKSQEDLKKMVQLLQCEFEKFNGLMEKLIEKKKNNN